MEFAQIRGGYWAADWSLAHSLLRTHVRQKCYATLGRMNKERAFEPSLLTKVLSFGYLDAPIITHYQIDTKDVESIVEREGQDMLVFLVETFRFDPQRALSYLRNRVCETAEFRAQYKRKLREASSATMGAIDDAVEDGEIAQQWAKHVRDTSVEICMVGAGFASGGSVWTLRGFGALAKGAAKYQDTGNVGAASLEATTTLIMAAISLDKIRAMKGSARVSSEATVIFLGATFDTMNALVSGETIQDALIAGGASVVKEAAVVGFDEIAKGQLVKVLQRPGMKSVLQKSLLPAKVTSRFDLPTLESEDIYDLSTSFAAGQAKAGGTWALKKALDDSNRAKKSTEKTAGARSCSQTSLVDKAIFPVSRLEYEKHLKKKAAR